MNRYRLVPLALALLLAQAVFGGPPKNKPGALRLIVMDPLAKELACACVKDYAQRDYRKIAARLEKATGQHVSIDFSAVTTPRDRVAIIVTEPLTTNETWTPCKPGELIVFVDGDVVYQVSDKLLGL